MQYFPSAFKTAETLRQNCSDPKTCPVFKWTEFPWIVQEFLDGGTGCAHNRRTVLQLEAMEAAIEKEDVIWHANAVVSGPTALLSLALLHSPCTRGVALFNAQCVKLTKCCSRSQNFLTEVLDEPLWDYSLGMKVLRTPAHKHTCCNRRLGNTAVSCDSAPGPWL